MSLAFRRCGAGFLAPASPGFLNSLSNLEKIRGTDIAPVRSPVRCDRIV
jgi:hypothetical protein